MLDFAGEGMLALWNGIDPARRREYDAWHTREHVPERASVPGMLGARRYFRTEGPLPEFLTLYAMRDTAVLGSPPYLKLLDEPTPWSRSMRASFQSFMRLCCRREWSIGGGAGGALGALVLDGHALPRAEDLRDSLAELLAAQPLLAAHFLIRDDSVPDVPFPIGGEAPGFPRAGVILLESYDDPALAETRPLLAERLAKLGAGAGAATFTHYRLAYALDRGSLGTILPLSEPARARIQH